MTATLAPFGAVATRNSLNGKAPGQEAYTIATSYATVIYGNDPVALDPTGTGDLTAGAAATHMFGILHGVEYTTSDGYYRVREGWTASQALLSGTKATAYIFRDPFTEFFMQNAGTVAQTAIGFGADIVIGSGNANNLTSTSTLSNTIGSGTTTKQFRIIGLAPLLNNAWGDTFTILRVIMNNLSGFLPMGGVISWV